MARVEQDEVIVTAQHRLGRKVPDLCVREMHEQQILDMAPAMTCDRIHWDAVDGCDMPALMEHLGPGVFTRQWSAGQFRVWVPQGAGYDFRDQIRVWAAANGVELVNARVEPKVPFRDLDSVPDGLIPELIGACTDWLFSRSYLVRRKLVTELELVEDDDVRSLMYLFVHDHADRFDSDRTGRNGTLNFTAFMFGKLRTWPQDAARTAYGRTIVSDRIALHRAQEHSLAAHGRSANETDKAAALGVTVMELRRREEAIATLAGLRNHEELIGWEVDRVLGVDVDGGHSGSDGVDSYDRAAEITKAILEAVSDDSPNARRTHDPLALAATYLTFWEGQSRVQVAKELEILPKTASAALARVLERLHASGLE
ncbi:MAG: hypothetical protein Q8L05_04095 [Actinomycetota bacterium]|nr:hypothetical protein [Actinomycetota bacterium]